MDRKSRILKARVCACAVLTLLIGGALWGREAAAATPQATPQFDSPGDSRTGTTPREQEQFFHAAIVTEDGPLKGILLPDIHAFLGIPYAAPPLGPLRWTPPQPYGRWQGVLEATQFGSPCP